MTSPSLALVPYVDRTRNPYCLTILRNIITFEAAVRFARHPHQIEYIIAELHCIVAGMSHMRDWSMFPRLVHLIHRARHIAYIQCHILIHRCAELIDACDRVDCTRREKKVYETSYEEVAQAVRACDDVLFSLELSQKAFYCQKLRPRLVSMLHYWETCSSDSSEQLQSVTSSPDKLLDVACNACTASAQTPTPPAAKRSRYTCS
jgi:hypothetical protein